MSPERSRNVQSIKPSQLKVGDTIMHDGKEAVIAKIGSWRDSVHGVVYGLDLIVRGKPVRASYVESGRVEIVN